MEKATFLPTSCCGFQRQSIRNVVARSRFVLLTICCKINEALTLNHTPHATPPKPCIVDNLYILRIREKSFYSTYLIIILKSLTWTQSLASSKVSTHYWSKDLLSSLHCNKQKSASREGSPGVSYHNQLHQIKKYANFTNEVWQEVTLHLSWRNEART